jgi:hypothetical protein
MNKHKNEKVKRGGVDLSIVAPLPKSTHAPSHLITLFTPFPLTKYVFPSAYVSYSLSYITPLLPYVDFISHAT